MNKQAVLLEASLAASLTNAASAERITIPTVRGKTLATRQPDVTYTDPAVPVGFLRVGSSHLVLARDGSRMFGRRRSAKKNRPRTSRRLRASTPLPVEMPC